jgi:pimeloyl-ACP methyl ester carboxylesterase
MLRGDARHRGCCSWAERAYPNNLLHFNELDRGGHFAAWEQPQLFSEEIRAAFRPLPQTGAASECHRGQGNG